MIDVRIRRGTGEVLWVRVGDTEPVVAPVGGLRRLVLRLDVVRIRIAMPGVLLDAEVAELLHAPPTCVREVRIGREVFVLERRFDAAALTLVVATCARLVASPESGWAGSPLPDSLARSLQSQPSRDSSSRPRTAPRSKASHNARAAAEA
jgi:hypothetical protein